MADGTRNDRPDRSDRTTREARAKAARAEQARSERRRKGVVVGVTAAVVAVIVAATAVVIVRHVAAERALDAAAEQPIEGVQEYGGRYGVDLGRDHVTEDVTYDPLPPVGGNHDAVWQNCGVYDDQALVADRNAVHSLEHGAVWVTYDPSLPQADVETLVETVSGSDYTLLSPYADLGSPVVASAWGEQLRLDDVSDPRLATFLRAYVQGPQTPEPGAPCTGGTGTPTS